eukprot:7357053-Lingulodinium_polyedra.AAC.1
MTAAAATAALARTTWGSCSASCRTSSRCMRCWRPRAGPPGCRSSSASARWCRCGGGARRCSKRRAL